jgi:hypothetical protein
MYELICFFSSAVFPKGRLRTSLDKLPSVVEHDPSTVPLAGTNTYTTGLCALNW